MCQYRPFTHTCPHGTPKDPSNHLLVPCATPSPPGTLCPTPKFTQPILTTGIPCWDCHQQRMSKLSMAANIWKYLQILDRLRTCEVEEMTAELRHYYALTCAVHEYGQGGQGEGQSWTPATRRRTDDERDCPTYWAAGISDLLKLVDLPGKRSGGGPGGGLPVRKPMKTYENMPVENGDGYTYEDVCGARVEMVEHVECESVQYTDGIASGH